MAQKTPLPALTVNYADRWNFTWFVDLSNFIEKIKEDFDLRMLIFSFLRLKRYSTLLISINVSHGFYFFNLRFFNTHSVLPLKPLVEPSNDLQTSLNK
jgi:hypothetical protein